jgi:hypothetical protein
MRIIRRSVKVKRKILADIVAGLARAPGVDPENVMTGPLLVADKSRFKVGGCVKLSP